MTDTVTDPAPRTIRHDWGYAAVAANDIKPAVALVEDGGWEVVSVAGLDAGHVGIVFRRLERHDVAHTPLQRLCWQLRACGTHRDRRHYEADPNKFNGEPDA